MSAGVEHSQRAGGHLPPVLLLALGFGLVGLDRWIITPVFPTMMRDLGLGYQDLGFIGGALAIAWGLSAVYCGRLADRFGRRAVIIPAVLAFSLLSAFTGVVSSVGVLIAVRAAMGITEGAYAPACTAAAAELAPPTLVGRYQGIVFCAFTLLGLGAGPLIATQLLHVVPSWRWVFFLAAVPGILLAVVLCRFLPETRGKGQAANSQVPWRAVLDAHNVRIAALGTVCAMSCVFVLGVLMPSYLTDYLQLSVQQMGVVMSALGVGGALGNFLLPALSDRLGRRRTVVLSAIAAGVALLVLRSLGANLPLLCLVLFVVAVFCFGMLSTFIGPIASEAVPAAAMSAAIGVVSGASEIFGGGVAPILGGFVAARFGVRHVLDIGIVALLLAVFVGLAVVETAPRRPKSQP
jgi:MFS family permease